MNMTRTPATITQIVLMPTEGGMAAARCMPGSVGWRRPRVVGTVANIWRAGLSTWTNSLAREARRLRPMPITRTRHPNVLAAQWSANGGAMGTTDLTQPGSEIYGANV